MLQVRILTTFNTGLENPACQSYLALRKKAARLLINGIARTLHHYRLW